MSRFRLNVDAVRYHPPSRSPRNEQDAPPKLPEYPLTRRRFFGLAAYGGLGVAPGWNVLEHVVNATDEPFTHQITKERIAFCLDGRERWVIDTRDFAGKPELHYRCDGTIIRIELTHARFPGTRIPADFTCDLRRGPLTWRMTLRFTLGEFASELPFVRWLAGREPAVSPVRLQQPLCELYRAGSVCFNGTAQATYSPDWSFRFRGDRIARLQGLGPLLESDTAEISLRHADSTSLMLDAAPVRTLMTLNRSSHEWIFSPPLAPVSGAKVSCHANTFDSIHVEACEPSRNHPIAVLYMSGPANGPGAVCESQWANGSEGLASFHLHLVSPGYLRLFDGSSEGGEQFFTARLSPTPVSLRVEGSRISVAGGEHVPPLEMHQHPTIGKTFFCEPAITTISVPLPGAHAEPLHLEAGARLRMFPLRSDAHAYVVASPLLQEKPSIQQLITPPPPSPSPPAKVQPGVSVERQSSILAALESDFRFQLKVGGPGTVSVVRPEDLLVLQIAWQGLELRITPGPPQLIRVPPSPGTKPRLTFYFPPQHVAEESFREEANPQNSQRINFPIQARLASWSRLVFEIPDEIQTIPYALEYLLDWSRFRPVVAPAAWPPPPEPVTTLQLLRFRPGISPLLEIPNIIRPQSYHPDHPMPRRYRTGPTARFISQIAAVLRRSEPRPFLVQLQQKNLLISPSAAPPSTALQELQKELIAPIMKVLPPHPPASAKELAAYTSIELPYRLFLSPTSLSAWNHAVKPVLLNGRHELWHTRLAVRQADGSTNETDSWYRTLRAIWSPDYANEVLPGPKLFDLTGPTPQNPFRMLPEANQRHQLVHLMSNAIQVPETEFAKWQYRVARANKFMLSSLGAWTDLRYADMDPPCGLTLVEWRQITTMGRDQYVRVVEKGFLFPFGHRALLVHVAERKFQPVDGRIFAVLRFREFIVVLEPVKKYPAPGQSSGGRDLPFQQIHITTKVTPNLSQPVLLPGVTGRAFWPQVNGQDFQFHIVASDWAGRMSELSMPLLFVDGNIGSNCDGKPEHGIQIQTVATHYNASDPVTLSRRTCPLNGQKVAFASPSASGQTALETTSVQFRATTIPVNPEGKANPIFFPHIESARVLVPPLKQLIGKDVTTIHYFDRYVLHGFGGDNVGEVFAVLDPPEAIRFPTNKSGGVAAPNFLLTGLSRRLGPIGGDLNVMASSPEANAADFFATVATRGGDGPSQDAANMLGCIPLASAIKGKLPSFLRMEELPQANPTSRWVILNLETELQPLPSSSIPIFVPWLGFAPTTKESDLPQGCCRAKLSLHVHSRTPLPRQGGSGAQPVTVVRGSLTNFQLNLGVLIISFKEIGFSSKATLSGGVVVALADLDPIRFAGPLSFLEVFRKFITNDVLGTLPTETLADRAKGVANFVVPSVPMGMFQFDNVGFTVGFDMPYDNSPMTFEIGFASSLSLGPYQGGSSFGLGFCADGIRKLELSMDFGGHFEINLYVAKGGVGVTGRIYYKIELISYKTFPWRGLQLELAGSIRMSGHVDVLGGLVGAGVEFELGLQLDIGTEENRVWGKAELTVHVEFLWKEESVSIPVEMEFKVPRLLDSSSSIGTRAVGPAVTTPVRIADLWSEQDWNVYAGAFADDL